MYMRNIWKGKRGTSLVEILVVMVVLLIGIMTLIQMFPTGFRIVKAGESQTIATRLAQQELERWKSMSANLPDSIVAINEAGIVMDDENPNLPFKGWYSVIVPVDGKDATIYRRGNALNFRQINGEFTLIPALSVLGGLSVSRYALTFGPIEVTRLDESSPWDGIEVKGRDLMRVGINSLAKAGQYKIDYMNGSSFKILFPSDRAARRFYYVSYSFWAVAVTGAPELFNVSDQRVDLPGGSWKAAWYDVNIPVPAGYNVISIEQESDSCARGFYQIAGNFEAGMTDEYLFRLADPIVGIIEFNNYAQGEYESTPLGLQPLAARINYKIYDPRIIHEDKVMSQPPANEHDIPVKMSLRFILNLNDPTDNPNEETYTGLLPSFQYPVYVIDLATGLQVLLDTNYLADIKQPGGKLDYRTGIIKVPDVADLRNSTSGKTLSKVPMVGRHLRFYYRAEGDWTVQCQKACTSYTKTSNATNIKYNRFFMQTPNRLLFALCQGEQTVSVDFSYGDPSGGSEHRMPAKAYQIQMDIPNRIGYVDLPVPEGQVINRISVVGISFRARVLWRDGAVWRKVDLDTTLTPTR
jgi:competence protein ComGC